MQFSRNISLNSSSKTIIKDVNDKTIICYKSEKFRESKMINGAKLGVAGVACATPLFLPRPEIMYKHASHFCPAPNLFSMCTTGFNPRLAPLAIDQGGL